MSAAPSLHELDARFRPVTLAGRSLLPVVDPLAPLLPGGGLRRGSTVSIRDAASTSLALALVAEASARGSWVALVGLSSVGLLAASELGVALDKVAVVSPPGSRAWGAVMAAAVDAFDLVLTAPARVRPAEARRLVARVRERGSVLLILGPGWPEPPDVSLRAGAGSWYGIGRGHGRLASRRVQVVATGRREAARPRSVELWLPAEGGGVAAVGDPVIPERHLHPVDPGG